MYDLILYDTSNFVDFPIGGQLTSIRHFLKYVAQTHPEAADGILLVGISTRQEEVGKVQTVDVDGCAFSFLPVMHRERELANVQGSLRAAYLKALFRFRREIPSGKATVHYIHTPEAFLAVKLLHPRAKTAVFSHGSYFNMADNFRFFRGSPAVKALFNGFVILLLKSADLIFTIDEPSAAQYRKYTKKICRAENSIILPETEQERKHVHTPVRLLFVGRLSKVKGIDTIVDAVSMANGKMTLTILGDGEERDALAQRIKDRKAEGRIQMAGSVLPSEMEACMGEHDILVMNSSFEGKPMAILEAMSCGLPVVTTPAGGIPEMVTQGQSAEFTDGTAEDILWKVNVIADHYAGYSREARNRVKKYDYRYVNESIWRQLSGI